MTKYSLPLTKRESEILDLLMMEKTNEEIASFLKISARTVELHRYRLMKKMNAKNSVALTKKYYWIE